MCCWYGGHQPSMLQDILAHRKTEIEAINGEVVRLANEVQIAAPVTETLCQLVRMLESADRPVP